jgi:transcriptional regulator GlxA family with amidase domain
VSPRRIGFLLFDGVTLLDFVGAYDALRRVPAMDIDAQVELRVVGTTGRVADDDGLRIEPDGVLEPLSGFDLLYVPGGPGTRRLMHDDDFLEYLRGYPADRLVASVCTGALLLGAAGRLAGRRATTHHRALDLLRPLCGEVVEGERVVIDDPVTTAGGVSASLDLGLHLVARHWGADARARVAAQMEYRA